MSYTLTTLDDGHIILMTMNADFDLTKEMVPSSLETFELLEAGPDRMVFISDGREMRLTSLNEIIESANTIRIPESKRVTTHPKLLKSLTVTNNKVIQLAVKGLNTATFGNIEYPIFESVEDAVNYARKLIYGEAKVN